MSKINNEKEYIMFELTKNMRDGELNFRTEQITKDSWEYIRYNLFASEQHNSTIEQMDLMPLVDLCDGEKSALVVIVLTDKIKNDLMNFQYEMFEYLQKYI